MLKQSFVFSTVPLSALCGVETIVGLFDILSGFKQVICPRCGTPDALRDRRGEIRCKNQQCADFDADWALKGKKSRRPKRTAAPTQGNFHPENPLVIRYRNFAGQEKTFRMELLSMVRRRNHLIGKVAPTGRRIALSREKIQNLGEVDAQLPTHLIGPMPSGDERRVLSFHLRLGSTSPLFEKIRAKYPDWKPEPRS